MSEKKLNHKNMIITLIITPNWESKIFVSFINRSVVTFITDRDSNSMHVVNYLEILESVCTPLLSK